ncbi:hypothetical protein TNCV_3062111 [Trichonephila clavipes]|nr:hypothetical protein TNCV_3062111 [Trichonephila clavipes]
MYHDEIPERCKLNFTGIIDDALRITGELFPKQTLKKNIRKEVEIDTDGRKHARQFMLQVSSISRGFSRGDIQSGHPLLSTKTNSGLITPRNRGKSDGG